MKFLAAGGTALVLDASDSVLEIGMVGSLVSAAAERPGLELSETDSLAGKPFARVIFVTDKLGVHTLEEIRALSLPVEPVLLVHSAQQAVLANAPALQGIFPHVVAGTHGFPAQAILRRLCDSTAPISTSIDNALGELTHRESFTIRNSRDRVGFRDALADFVGRVVKDLRYSSPLSVQRAVCVQEELLMNAIFDADPQFSSAIPRREGELAEGIAVVWGWNGSVLGIEVTDSFGSLSFADIAKCFEYLVRGQDRRRYVQMQQETPGAGIGIFMVIERSNHLLFSVVPGKRTRALALLDLSRTQRENHSRQRMLEIVVG